MKTLPVSRRSFLAGSISAAAMAAVPASTSFSAEPAPSAGASGTIRLGGPSFAKTDDPEQLALVHRQLGYRAAYCPNIAVSDRERLRALREAFAKHDIVIAEVGRWVNLLEADPEKRRKNLETVIDGLALAEEVGARCCVDIAGSFNEKIWYGPHPDNLSRRFFDAAVENARKIIDAVKPTRTTFCYEMMGWALPDSPDSYVKMVKAVDRKAFAVHLDPCNLINSPERFYRNRDLLNECFDKLGRWIVSCHAKDLAWEVEMNVHFREVGAGKGELDYETYLRRLVKLPQQAPLMIEHLPNPEEYVQAAKHIKAVGGKLGLLF